MARTSGCKEVPPPAFADDEAPVVVYLRANTEDPGDTWYEYVNEDDLRDGDCVAIYQLVGYRRVSIETKRTLVKA